MEWPILLKAGDRRVLINGHPPLLDCRVVAESTFQQLEKESMPAEIQRRQLWIDRYQAAISVISAPPVSTAFRERMEEAAISVADNALAEFDARFRESAEANASEDPRDVPMSKTERHLSKPVTHFATFGAGGHITDVACSTYGAMGTYSSNWDDVDCPECREYFPDATSEEAT